MDRSHTQKLVEGSFVLTAEEKAYWLRNLPKLNDDQCAQLAKILADDGGFSRILAQFLSPLEPALMAVLERMPKISA